MTECEQFRRDMEAAGIETEPYSGRFYWKGPAARTHEPWPTLQDVLRSTTVQLQWDTLGRAGHIVYPVASETA